MAPSGSAGNGVSHVLPPALQIFHSPYPHQRTDLWGIHCARYCVVKTTATHSITTYYSVEILIALGLYVVFSDS